MAIIGIEKGILLQHLEATIIYEENPINANNNMVILDIYPIMKGDNKKVEENSANANKTKDKQCQYCKKSKHQKEKCLWNLNNSEKKI
jgi:hypothetical protein